MDVRVPTVDGVEATRQILSPQRTARRQHVVGVLMLTTFDLDDRAADAIRYGASGCLLKDATPAMLSDAIRSEYCNGSKQARRFHDRLVGHGVTDVDGTMWSVELDRLHARFAGWFARSEPRRRARQYLSGLVADLDRGNGWTLAGQAGDISPHGMQRLLRWADWDVDAVRDDVRDYVIEHLGDPNGVLIIDDTGFLNKGVKSAGVARQYSGTAGRVENCQVGVFMAYRSSKGHALIDRQLYLPRRGPMTVTGAGLPGVPDEAEFATKVQMTAPCWPGRSLLVFRPAG